MRCSLVFGIGVMGEEEDIQQFMELMTADLELRAHRAAERLFAGRIQLLEPAEMIEADEEIQ